MNDAAHSEADLQLNADGSLRHLLTLKGLDRDLLIRLLDDAEQFLTEEGKKNIEEYRKELRPEIATAYAGIIIGHTDSTGSAEYNLGLSKRRAQAVSDHLVSTGVAEEKLRIVAEGFEDEWQALA